jgi:transposase-like protein
MHTIIFGKDAEYLPDGLLARPGGHLILKDGMRYTFDVIEMPNFDAPDRINNLIEVERLAYGVGKWMLGSESFFESLADVQFRAFTQLNRCRAEQRCPPIQWELFRETVQESHQLWFREQTDREAAIAERINSEFFGPSYARRWHLARLIRDEQCETLRREVCAVTWFEGSVTPLLLRDFSEIKSPQTADLEAKLQNTEKRAENAEQAGSLTLKEALSKWMRFDPPGMAANTQARIEKAVKLYLTEPEKRSLAKIASEFGVTRTTVSRWFRQFTKETDFPVIRHVRHESVRDQLLAEKRGTDEADEKKNEREQEEQVR